MNDTYRRFISPDKSTSVTIVYDQDCGSPRNCDGLTTKIIVLLDKYDHLGDDHDFTDMEELKASEYFDQNKYVAWPLFVLDHSGLRISMGKFPGHEWDTSMIGWIFRKIDEDDGGVQAVKDMQGDIDEYNMWLAGETFGVIVSKIQTCPCCGNTEEEEIDSCFGIIGEHDAIGIAASLQRDFDPKTWTETKEVRR